jgi:hypothetical protein
MGDTAEFVVSIVAIVVSVFSALVATYIAWRVAKEANTAAAGRDRDAVRAAAASAHAQLRATYSKDVQPALAFLSIFARVPGNADAYNQHLTEFMQNPSHVRRSLAASGQTLYLR